MSTFPAIPKHGHRPRFSKEARVPLPTSRVTPTTKARVNGWMKGQKLSRGLVLDRVVEHAHVAKVFPSKSATKTK